MGVRWRLFQGPPVPGRIRSVLRRILTCGSPQSLDERVQSPMEPLSEGIVDDLGTRRRRDLVFEFRRLFNKRCGLNLTLPDDFEENSRTKDFRGLFSEVPVGSVQPTSGARKLPSEAGVSAEWN